MEREGAAEDPSALTTKLTCHRNESPFDKAQGQSGSKTQLLCINWIPTATNVPCRDLYMQL
jgi:hypothetical protein